MPAVERRPDDDFTVAPVATPDILKRVYAFDEHSYVDARNRAGENISFPLFQEWWHAYPTGFLCAFRQDQPFAVIGLFPVTGAWAGKFLAHETSERDLRGETIKASPRKVWYFSGLSSNAMPGLLGTKLPCILGRTLLQWVQINATALGDTKIVIVSEGTTTVGAKLLGRLLASEPVLSFDDGQKPRFKLTTDLAEITRMLAEKPFFARCKGLRDEATRTLAAIGQRAQ
jgi:hypothetical protein